MTSDDPIIKLFKNILKLYSDGSVAVEPLIERSGTSKDSDRMVLSFRLITVNTTSRDKNIGTFLDQLDPRGTIDYHDVEREESGLKITKHLKLYLNAGRQKIFSYIKLYLSQQFDIVAGENHSNR